LARRPSERPNTGTPRMASCGCCGGSNEDEAKNEFKRGSANDLSEGPIRNRSCTDVFCIPIFIAAQVVFILVTIAGMQDGDPSKLYKPRDYRGAYCGVEENWNDGPNTASMHKLSYTMNVTSMVDEIMKQTLCSSYAAELLTQGDDALLNATQVDKYLCDCCLRPCAACEGALDNGGDLTNSDLSSVISSRMAELTDPSQAGNLFSPSGANGDKFSSNAFWEQATKYFNQVCLPTCEVDANATAGLRSYTYTPSPDSAFSDYWDKLLSMPSSPARAAMISTLDSVFTFEALPLSQCPYDESLCVPFPGLKLSELSSGSNYCTFEMAAEVVSAVGDAAATAFSSLGLDSISGAATESFGKWVGDFQETIDTFLLVSVLSFCTGLVFLVLLRFFIGACVWVSVFITVLMFVFGGFFVFVLSGQCEGAGIFDSGKQTAVAIVVAGQSGVVDAVSGEDVPSEDMTGDGVDYLGRQQYSKFGRKCLTWETQAVFPDYRAGSYDVLSPAASTKNYCRNPYHADDVNKANTIWCITSDPDVPWEECIPIGVIQPECARGYAVSNKTARDALYYSSFVIWGLGLIWLIVILCMVNRIRLAIALNKVAAVYVASNPTTLLIPVVQAILGITWCVLWFYAASFLLSQVPDAYIPKGAYRSYAEAYGIDSPCAFWETGDHCAGTPGACTDNWPTGGVWRDSNCDESDGVTKCWRCSPPRYIFDARFAASFFVFLWNNAFNVALGQILIAMCVGLWFFTLDKKQAFVVKRGISTVMRYHIGTVAFGSFIVAVVQFIRYLMQYFEKQAAAQKNRCMVILLKCLQCCIWCFEKCLKFLNKNAYIQTALLGTNFCTSAKKAFYLIFRNLARFGTMAVLGTVIRAIGIICIVSGTAVIGYFLMREMHPEVSPFVPLVLFIMVAYIIAKLYMNVFGLAVDTCLQCFLAVEEMKIGADYIPSVLRGFVDSSGKQLGDNQE